MRLLLVVACVCVTGCEKPTTKLKPSDLPSGDLVYQPTLFWRDASVSRQGTGFFAKTPQGLTVGITSAHFVDFDGPALIRAEWRRTTDDKPVAVFEDHLGAPGDGGTETDLRSDYLVLLPKDNVESVSPLGLDTRAKPLVGERVWLPNKDGKSPSGYALEAGTVVEASTRFATIEFDRVFHLQSQSGSPLISQMTGKVVGILARGGASDGKVFIMTAPSAGILAAIEAAKNTPKLEAVVGK